VRAGVKEAGVLDGDVRFCLVLPREALSVPVMRRVLGGTLLGFGADEDCVADILLAASEACTNVLKHGGGSGEYEVSASVGKNACLLEIADGAPSRGPRAVRHPDARRLRAASRPITRVRARANAISGGTTAVTVNGNGHGAASDYVPAEAQPAEDVAAGDAVTAAELAEVASPEAETETKTAGAVPAGDVVAAADEPDVSSLSESGRGLTIMRACMDDLTMRGTRGRGTVVSMRKQITWARAVNGRHASPPGTRPARGLRDAG
jgi:anti-sigma regulatory factor (Ser/Thr protein kinase)